LLNGSLVRVIDTTQTVPGSTGDFRAEGSADRGPVVSDGRVAFYSLGNGIDPSTGIGYYGRDANGNLVPLVTYEDHLPGSGSNIVGLGGVSLDTAGDYVFSAYGGSEGGLYYSGQFGEGSYSQIVSASTLDGKLISDINVNPYSLSGNEVAFSVRFQDGSSGLYLATLNQTVPEPGSIVLTGLGLSFAVMARRRLAKRAAR
jgi:hypothetical protein